MWYDNIIMYSDLLGNWDIYVFLLWGFCIYNKICFFNNISNFSVNVNLFYTSFIRSFEV